MSDQITLVVTASPNPNEMEAVQDYVTKAGPLLAGAGGIPVKRLKITDVFFGDKSFAILLVMDFPSKQAVVDMFNSDAYQALVPSRDKGFFQVNIFFAEAAG